MLKLTSKMNTYLKTIARGTSSHQISASTQNALVKRGLVERDGRLTAFGFEVAVSLLPLTEQCEALKIPLVKMELNYTGRPEDALLSRLHCEGYVGTSNEGLPIHTLLKASVLDRLEALNPFHDRSDACTRYLEAQLTTLKDNHSELIEAARIVTKQQLLENTKEVMCYDSVKKDAPSLTIDFASSFYEAVGPEGLGELLAFMARDPYGLRAGWPDLVLIKERQIFFVEVKTRDKLHASQIKVIPMLRKTLNCSIHVYQLPPSG